MITRPAQREEKEGERERESKREREREQEIERERERHGTNRANAHIAQEHTASRKARRTATTDRTDERSIGGQKPPLRTVFERGD